MSCVREVMETCKQCGQFVSKRPAGFCRQSVNAMVNLDPDHPKTSWLCKKDVNAFTTIMPKR